MKTVIDTARFENHFLLFHHATDVDIDKIASEHGDGMRKYLVKVTATLDDLFKLERFLQTNLECVFEQQGSDEQVDRPKKLGMFHASKSP
jgi:hypothetical protein